MPDWFSKALDWLKTPAHYFLPVLITTAFGLFAPTPWLDMLGIAVWRTEGKVYLGSFFVISAAVVICHYGAFPLRWLWQRMKSYFLKRTAIRRLESLTRDEKTLLAKYLEEDTRTQKLWMEDGVAAGLVHANIIYPAVSQADVYEYPFNVRPWVWEHLKKNPQLVGMQPNELTNNGKS